MIQVTSWRWSVGPRAVAGDEEAASLLAGLLIKQGRGEEAERLRRFGLHPDGSMVSA